MNVSEKLGYLYQYITVVLLLETCGDLDTHIPAYAHTHITLLICNKHAELNQFS